MSRRPASRSQRLRIHGSTLDTISLTVRSYEACPYTEDERKRVLYIVSSPTFKQWAWQQQGRITAARIRDSRLWSHADLCNRMGWDSSMLEVRCGLERVTVADIIMPRLHGRMVSMWNKTTSIALPQNQVQREAPREPRNQHIILHHVIENPRRQNEDPEPSGNTFPTNLLLWLGNCFYQKVCIDLIWHGSWRKRALVLVAAIVLFFNPLRTRSCLLQLLYYIVCWLISSSASWVKASPVPLSTSGTAPVTSSLSRRLVVQTPSSPRGEASPVSSVLPAVPSQPSHSGHVVYCLLLALLILVCCCYWLTHSFLHRPYIDQQGGPIQQPIQQPMHQPIHQPNHPPNHPPNQQPNQQGGPNQQVQVQDQAPGGDDGEVQCEHNAQLNRSIESETIEMAEQAGTRLHTGRVTADRQHPGGVYTNILADLEADISSSCQSVESEARGSSSGHRGSGEEGSALLSPEEREMARQCIQEVDEFAAQGPNFED